MLGKAYLPSAPVVNVATVAPVLSCSCTVAPLSGEPVAGSVTTPATLAGLGVSCRPTVAEAPAPIVSVALPAGLVV
jgi:hypothetical protein